MKLSELYSVHSTLTIILLNGHVITYVVRLCPRMTYGHVAWSQPVAVVRALQTHVITHCTIDDFQPISQLLTTSCGCRAFSFLSGANTGAASVATFPRHVTAEYGTPACTLHPGLVSMP